MTADKFIPLLIVSLLLLNNEGVWLRVVFVSGAAVNLTLARGQFTNLCFFLMDGTGLGRTAL